MQTYLEMIRGLTKKEELLVESRKLHEKELAKEKKKVAELKEEVKGVKCKIHRELTNLDLDLNILPSLRGAVINQALVDKLVKEFDTKN